MPRPLLHRLALTSAPASSGTGRQPSSNRSAAQRLRQHKFEDGGRSGLSFGFGSAPPMPAAPHALRVISSLRLGERSIARCGDGLLAAENALFDARDTVLRMTDPGTVREAGYMTTAGEALGRLALAGVTPEFAEDAARALAPRVLASFARGETARALTPHLGPHEIFDGAV